MELHPILDKSTSPNGGLWYVLSALGECPTQRVGQTASYVPGPDGQGGHVYIVGGANPNGPFSETYVLDIDTLSWDVLDAPGLKARYEHAAFSPTSQPDKIYVFGGADQGGNHNDVQQLDVTARVWSSVSVTLGTPPCARTYHVTSCGAGERLVVYSGGQSGSDPVGDRQVHVFDAGSGAWEVLSVRGDPPKPRHGHLVVSAPDKVYVHGGMSGTTFYDDLYVLDLKAGTWRGVKQRRGHPCARAAHGGAICGTDMYLFGGMNREGALDDFYKLDTGTLKWTRITLEGPPPACRLDFAFCIIRMRVPAQSIEPTEQLNASRLNARDVLDSQLRLGSAGSVRSLGSVGSAGSQRSAASVGSAGSGRADPALIQELSTESLVVSGSQLPQQQDPLPEVAEAASCADSGAGAASTEEDIEYKTVDMCLIFGGMDTEGEIFDDCLVYLIS